jgi:phosphatidylserine/phosphatidylglycerophosphate/cardiolipin synthase-like enzyme
VLLITHDPAVVNGLHTLFKNDVQARAMVRRHAIGPRLIVGPEHSRAEIRKLVAGAKSSIRILDHKLSDPDLVGLLRERRSEGITVSVLGKRSLGLLVPHGKMMIIDESLAILGSTALSTLSLDFRREVSVIVDDSQLVRKLNVMFQHLSARAGAAATHLPGDRLG